MEYRDTAHSQRALAILIAVAAVLQVALAPQISILGGRINFMIILAGVVALMGNASQAVYVGFGAGLLFLTAGSFVLVQMASAGTSGFSSTSLRFMGIFSVGVCMLNGIALFFMGSERDLLLSLGGHGLMSAVLTTVVSIPFLMLSGSMASSRSGFSAHGYGTRFKSASRGRGRRLW